MVFGLWSRKSLLTDEALHDGKSQAVVASIDKLLLEVSIPEELREALGLERSVPIQNNLT